MTTTIAEAAKTLGVTEKQLESLVNQQIYRKEYNARPEVKLARRMYNRKRYARLQQEMREFKEWKESQKQ